MFFKTMVLLIVLAFLLLAMQWYEIMEKWTEIDEAMRSYGFPKTYKLKLSIFAVLFVAAGFSKLRVVNA